MWCVVQGLLSIQWTGSVVPNWLVHLPILSGDTLAATRYMCYSGAKPINVSNTMCLLIKLHQCVC